MIRHLIRMIGYAIVSGVLSASSIGPNDLRYWTVLLAVLIIDLSHLLDEKFF